MKFKLKQLAKASAKTSLIGCLALSLTLPAGSTGWLENFFNETGTYNNVTSGGAVHGQTMNMYTGGSLYTRVPQRNYQLVGFQPPNISAGCGGINLTAGSFSFINKEQFIAMLRNIGQASIGHAFMLALKSMAPEVAEVMQYLQTRAQEMNSHTINACTAAQTLVDGTIGKVMQANSRKAADWALALNRDADGNAAYQRTRDSYSESRSSIEDARQNLNGVRPTGSGRATPAIMEGNIIWRNLTMDVTGFNNEERQILMSLIGTIVIVDDPSPDMPPRMVYKQSTLKLPDLIGSLTSTGTARGVSLLTCLDGTNSDQCLDVEITEDVQIKGFRELVMTKLDRMRGAMLDRNWQQAGDMDFANYTSLPIQRMLSASTTMKFGGISQSLSEKWGDIAAAEYAAAFVRHGLDILEKGLSQGLTNKTALEAEQIDKFRVRIVEARREVQSELRKAYAQGDYLVNLSGHLEHMERAMRSGFSQQTNAALSFGRDRSASR